MFTCYAIDDEPSALETLIDYIDLNPNLNLIKVFNEPFTALDFIKKSAVVDIIFLDIEMPGLNGIELAKLIQHKTKKIVFATAYTKYGYDAIELNANGYLLKPYPYKKFDSLIEKLFLNPINNHDPSAKSFLIKQAGNRNKQFKIILKEILFFESQLRYTKIRTFKENILSHSTFSEIKELLFDKKEFIQIHRSFIICIDYIKAIESKQVILIDESKIPIGRNYRSQFLKSVQKN